MTATFIDSKSHSIMKNHPLTSSALPTIRQHHRPQQQQQPQSLAPSSPSTVQPPSPPHFPLEKLTHPIHHDDTTLPSTIPSKVVAYETATTTTIHSATTTMQHDIFISLSSPTLTKKKSLNQIEFKPDTSSEAKSRYLTPASVQLLRNLLLSTNRSDTPICSLRRNRNACTNTPNYNHTTVRRSNNNNGPSRQQMRHLHIVDNSASHQQHIQHRTLNRLESEPIPNVRDTTVNDSSVNHHHHNMNQYNDTSTSSTTTVQQQQQQQRRRRQIFGSFWETTSTTALSACSISTSNSTERSHPHYTKCERPHNEREFSATRTRSNSCYSVVSMPVEVLSSSSACTTPLNTITKPLSHVRSRSDGYQYNDTNSASYGELSSYNHYHYTILASLPSPMQRLRKSSGGVYPLVQPKSILRNRIIPRRNSSNSNVVENVPAPPPPSSSSGNGRQISQVSDDGSTTNTDFDRSSSISSSNNSIHSIPNGTVGTVMTCTNCDDSSVTRRHLVRFDPRITITELAGRDHDRVWYTDSELNRFKYETVVTARSYFSQHPDQILYYNQPFYDPVTKTMRKRALFNLPVLANIAITDHDDHAVLKTNELPDNKRSTNSNNVSQHDQQHLLSQLAFEEGDMVQSTSSGTNVSGVGGNENGTIRTVLVVDHNRWILDLFVRSLQTMFNGDNKDCSNHVIVECAPNVPVAMAIIAARQHRKPPFDVIIAEQLPSRHILPPTQQLTTICDTIDEIGNGDTNKSSKNTNTISLSGADLLFHNLPQEYRNQMLLISVAPSAFSMPSNSSTKLNNKDNNPSLSPSSTMRSNSIITASSSSSSLLSDLVWSKPPPRMDHNLRTQVIRTLQMKRERLTRRN